MTIVEHAARAGITRRTESPLDPDAIGRLSRPIAARPSTRPVGLRDPMETFRLGLHIALANQGLDVHEVDDVPEWLGEWPAAAVVIAVGDDDVISCLHARHPEARLVALVERPDPAAYAEALARGAAACVDRSLAVSLIAHIVVGALSGMTVIPTPAAFALARRFGTRRQLCHLERSERSWLNDLARGTTVVELARAESYSEREMYRLLQRLWRRMGVSGRTEALLLASREGVIES